MFQRFYDEGLAQASFLLGCDRTKQAVVVDPRRDASIYAEAASLLAQEGLPVVNVAGGMAAYRDRVEATT